MRNRVIQIIVFIVCFIGGVIGINYVMGTNAGDNTLSMDQATLPLVYTKVASENVNCLHGYTSDIDAALLRDTLTPLEEGEPISLLIENDNYTIKKMHYELRSADASSLVEDGDIKSFKTDKNKRLKADLSIRMQLKEDQDYILKLVLVTEGGVDLTYYTRVLYGTDLHMKEQIAFCKKFNEALLSKQDAEQMKTYLEPDPSKTSTDLGHVDITSSFEAITYADMAPSFLSKPMISITNVNQDVASLKFRYVLSAKSSGGNQEYYEAQETYRVRYTKDRMYLLSYDRTMESFYDPVFTSTSSNSLKLGIAKNSGLSYMVSKDNKQAAFVKNQELYLYDNDSAQVVKVFSFLQEDKANVRDSYDQHGIKIMRIDEKGNLAFLVYGYMNRGRYEGQNGILFYEYHAEENQIEEIAFVPSKQPFAALTEDVQQVAYMNKKRTIYVTLNGGLYEIDPQKKSAKLSMDQVASDTVVASKDYHLIALYSDADIRNNQTITVKNLNDQKEHTIKADEGEVLRSLGFVDEDFVYGKVKTSDIVSQDADTIYYPMYEIVIMNKDGEIVKRYKPKKSSQYVMSATITGTLVELHLSQYKNGSFHEQGSYHIMGNEGEEQKSVMLDYTYNSVRYKELYMVFPNTVYVTEEPKSAASKEKRVDAGQTIKAEEDDITLTRYYIYHNGEISASVNTASEAIRQAAKEQGGVINSRQKTIWDYSGIKEYGTVGDDVPMVKADDVSDSKAAAVAMLLQYEGVETTKESLDKEKEVTALISEGKSIEAVNLSGITLSDAMYYVCQKHPVIARRKDGSYILITSFNASLVRYSDPLSGEVKREDFETVSKELLDAGNCFYSYVK